MISNLSLFDCRRIDYENDTIKERQIKLKDSMLMSGRNVENTSEVGKSI